MTDEQDGLDASLGKRKLTKRERFRGAVQRGVNKVKRSDEESAKDGQFSLNDDVKEFLAFRSPYAAQSSSQEVQTPDTKLPTTPPSQGDADEFLRTPDPSDVLPHFPTLSRDPLPVPRIDVTKSPRFPQARDLTVANDEGDIVPAPQIADDARGPPRRKARPKGLAVRFSNNPPLIIGEGGDEAEAPTMYLMQTRTRSKSDASMPERQQHPGQSPPSHITRKPVASTPQSPRQYISPQSLQSMEFDMVLTPGLGHKSNPTAPTLAEVPEPPTARIQRLRMRAEEGKTLRESFHEASFDVESD